MDYEECEFKANLNDNVEFIIDATSKHQRMCFKIKNKQEFWLTQEEAQKLFKIAKANFSLINKLLK